MKDVRRNRAKDEFNSMKQADRETLFLYSKRLEKSFRRAFPKKEVEKSRTLREKFHNTVPAFVRKSLNTHTLANEINDKTTTWSAIQKLARCQDARSVGQKKSISESPKDIIIGLAEQDGAITKKAKVPVFYNSNTKEFIIEDGEDKSGMRSLKPPRVFFADKQPTAFARNGSDNRQKYSYSYNPHRKNEMYRWKTDDQKTQRPREAIRCFFCGKQGHVIKECRNRTCYSCGAKGHIAYYCKNKNPKHDGPRKNKYSSSNLEPRGRYNGPRPFSNNNRGSNFTYPQENRRASN